ncbi:uncharacterized protein [Physcomitrium patens]|uniref:Uncharacterized protein n=1 Tax=Physcomitrium patens TaxID=3218 RepID=A0A2K1INU5_PHYPA|nr:uncharacterized protein LOC112274700 [Physcomitrium patens]PNR30952.1 hypothetical protein PHYPA_027268 [Physcomitrium patens]|eukprot:XP_024360150.1 uncharacterized protein LOC112274700 [Physcomitrella patens]
MTESGDCLSLCNSLGNMDVALGESFSEAMHTDSKVNSMDANLSGPDEVSAGTSLQDATSMAENETSVDECRRSESLIYSQEPTPTGLPGSQGLNESRNELLQRVQALKKDLENWRAKLDTQVKSYREELGGLRCALNLEVDQLRVGFQDLRNILKHQQELTATKLANLDEPKEPVIHSKSPLQDAALDTNLTA